MNTHELLIVGRDAARDNLADFLSAEGFATRTVPTSADASGHIESDPPSLVVLDISPPILDSVRLSCQLRKCHRAVPIIVIAAEPLGRHFASEIGADAFLQKPADPSDLLSIVLRYRDGQQITRRWSVHQSLRWFLVGAPKSGGQSGNAGLLARMWQSMMDRSFRRQLNEGRPGRGTPAPTSNLPNRGTSIRTARKP